MILREQNQSLKCCQPLDFLYTSLKGFDLLILQIKSLSVKGLQSYCSSKFENGLTPDKVEPRPNALALTSAVKAKASDFFLRLSTLTTSNFEALKSTDLIFTALKDLNLLKRYIKN